MIAPTIAWEVETGSPNLVIHNTVTAALNETTNAPASLSIAPNAPSPCAAPLPPTTAPRIMNRQLMAAAVRKETIFVPTAVPKILAASFAPSDHPMNKALDRKSMLVNTLLLLHHPLHGIDKQILGDILGNIRKTGYPGAKVPNLHLARQIGDLW